MPILFLDEIVEVLHYYGTRVVCILQENRSRTGITINRTESDVTKGQWRRLRTTIISFPKQLQALLKM